MKKENSVAPVERTTANVRLAQKYVEDVTGIPVSSLRTHHLCDGLIIFSFRNKRDYRYAQFYAELNRLGPPNHADQPVDGKRWAISDQRTIVMCQNTALGFIELRDTGGAM